MNSQYTIAIDRNHDGRFLSPQEDIADDVLELNWRLGMRQPYDSVADYGSAEIVLRNAHGNFSPEREGLDIGTRVQIASDDDSGRVALFTGFISHIAVAAGNWSAGRAVIHVQDIQPWLEASPARLSPISDVPADAVIDRLLDGSMLRRRALAGYCIIDVPGHNLVDSARVFPAQNLGRKLQAGKTRFAYVGDWWDESTSARQAISELAASERGRFYIDRNGEAVFLNRHHTLVNESLAAEFVDDMTGMAYAYGDQRVNQISLLMTPREVGESGTTIWQLARPQRIGAQTSLTLVLRFTDDMQQPIGLLELDRLEAAFHRDEAGNGRAITDRASARPTEIGFTSLQVQLDNSHARDVFLTELSVIGKPLYRRDPLELTVYDGAGIHLHGIKGLTMNLPALSDIVTAQAFASYELARRKHPAGTVRELRLDARQHPAARKLTLFDRIRISEAQTGHQDKEYFIIGEAHHVSRGGARHEIRLTLEPADLSRFVIIDDSALNDPAEIIAPY